MTDKIGDLEGTPCTRSEVAAGLGFVNEAAMDLWDIHRKSGINNNVDWLVSEMCNVLIRIKELEARCESLERDSHPNDNPRIGGVS